MPRCGVVITLERRGGGPEQDDALLHFSPNDGNIAGVVAGRFLLLVGGLVFFIDDDEPDVFERGEDGAARADDDPGAAGVELVPFVVSLAFRQVAVQDRDHVGLGGEPALETLDRLRGERNFRDEDDGGLAAREGGADGLQINFRFPAAGHAVKQNGRMRFRSFERVFDQLERGDLLFVHREVGVGDELLRAVRIARHRLLAQLGEAAFHERAQGAVIERSLAQEVGRGDWRGQLRDRFQQLGLARGAFAQLLDFLRRRDPDRTNEKLFLPADLRFADDLREQAAHHGFDRAAVIIRHPAREFDQGRAQDRFLADDNAATGLIPSAGLSSRVATTVARSVLSRNGTRTRDPTTTLPVIASGTL